VDGALYKSPEFSGDGLKELSMADRLTISNMAIEAGGKNGIFPVDDITREFLNGRVKREWTAYYPDDDAEYESVIEMNLDDIDCTVSYPHLPENAKPAREGHDVKIDQIVIGSCTNGKIEDMKAAAEILKGKHLAEGVRGIIIPATMNIYRECMKLGYTDIFLDAGCVVSTPTCGPCLGGYMGILAEGERCVSTTNRNFVGRMGHTNSEVYLASPAVAAASGITGHITHPEEVM
ncbi:MAG: 3-isopropylmalate dehydratase large subunit, partial [Synergistaceae bacterium]|nr:3-isopropylmalate dehydratase large subunit [Synergistaceae bacterium]